MNKRRLTRFLVAFAGCFFANTALFSSIALASESSCVPYLSEDQKDFIRLWGVQILAADDPAYSESEYIDQLMKARAPSTVSYATNYQSPFSFLSGRYKVMMINGDDDFHPRVTRFTNSGTEANNAMIELSEIAYEQRTGKKAVRPYLLYFGNPYGGTFGRIADYSNRYPRKPGFEETFHIPTPHFLAPNPPTGEALQRLRETEDQAIDFIRRQMSRPDLEISGVFMEFVSADPEHGILMFRTHFMHRLRALADELNFPIFGDEILTGGGRTGKFWAYQHYGDFVPDIQTRIISWTCES